MDQGVEWDRIEWSFFLRGSLPSFRVFIHDFCDAPGIYLQVIEMWKGK